MPAIGPVLGQLIEIKIDQYMKSINGKGPMSSLQNPSYYKEMCKAIASGFAQGTVSVSFTTQDTGLSGVPPVPGAGTGTGIIVDAEYMAKEIYTAIRNKIIEQFGQTTHDPWPPKPGNSGLYLSAISRGIADAVKEHYASAWTLTSVHPFVYMGSGVIKFGNFSGLSAENITNLILSNGPQLKGDFWPTMAAQIAKGYVKGIHERSTGTVTIAGVCVPSISQVCGLPGAGTGSGVAS